MKRLNLLIHGNNPLCRLTTCDKFWVSGRLLDTGDLCHSKCICYQICIDISLRWPNLPHLSTSHNTGLLLFLWIIIIRTWTMTICNKLILSAIAHPLCSLHLKLYLLARYLLLSFKNNRLFSRVKHGRFIKYNISTDYKLMWFRIKTPQSISFHPVRIA
jgi:hypothetical protein